MLSHANVTCVEKFSAEQTTTAAILNNAKQDALKKQNWEEVGLTNEGRNHLLLFHKDHHNRGIPKSLHAYIQIYMARLIAICCGCI